MKIESAFLPGKRKIAVESALEDNTLACRVRISRDLRRYLRKSQFYIRYAQDISAEEGLLNIPGVALLLPLAWLTDSDLHVRCLDRTFVGAAEALQRSYQAMYPKMLFGTRLVVDEPVDCPPNPEGAAMLFSGGIDATYSYFANRHLSPRLVQVFGTEFPCSETRHLGRVMQQSSAFADEQDVDISFIHTNFSYLFDNRAITHKFSPVRERASTSLWQGVGYAPGLLAMSAPLSAGRFNHLIIAAGADKEHADRMRENPDASSPKADQKMAWSNLKVEHHGCLHRFEKARKMKEWLPGKNLRVCLRFNSITDGNGTLNCGRCEKCARSIVALAIAGVDPSKCGFAIDNQTVSAIKTVLMNRKSKNSYVALFWGPMQRVIPDPIEGGMFGFRECLEWFRTFDLGNGVDPEPPLWSISRLYSLFPYPVSLAARSFVYGMLGEPDWRNRKEQ
jgi:hypothetical protein